MSEWKGITGSTSAELRDRFLDQHFRPLAARAFAADPEVGALVLAVAQFWCDEADDAVHAEIVPTADRHPRWPECLRDPRFYDADEDYAYPTERTESLVGWEASRDLPQLDDNSTMITAFGAYCVEGCDQEMAIAEAYRPFAVARRGPDGAIEVEVVGVVHQPHWEDRFDVGFSDDAPAGNLALADEDESDEEEDAARAATEILAEAAARREVASGRSFGDWFRAVLGRRR